MLREELVDRFGELPEPARALLECHRVRIAARPLGVARIDATHEAVQLQFIKNPPLDGAKVIEFIRRKGRAARLAGPEKLRVEAKLPAWQERAQAVKDILKQLRGMNLVVQGPALAGGDLDALAPAGEAAGGARDRAARLPLDAAR